MRTKKTFITLISVLLLSSLSLCIANNKPWVAVHDFSISPKLSKIGIKGWDIAGKLENELVQTGKFRLVIREKIGKVLKEKNISSSGSLAPSDFGKMIGAEYIITGNLTQSDNKLILIGKLVDVTKETGEVERSFDITEEGDNSTELLGKLPGMFEQLAKKLSMTPGEYLDNGIRFMNNGQYAQAVESFKIAKTLTPVNRIKKLIEDTSITTDKPVSLSKNTTPGELLDYGILMLNENKNKKAVEAFKSFEEINPFEQIKQLFEIGKLEKAAEQLKLKQVEKVNSQITEAESFIISIKESVPISESKIPEDKLCDLIITNLHNILRSPKINLSHKEKTQITKLIAQLKEIKPLIVVERDIPIIAVLPFTMNSSVKSRNSSMKIINKHFGEDLTNNLVNFLQTSRKLEVISSKDVASIMSKNKIVAIDISNTEEEFALGRKLNTDYMILGYLKKKRLILKPINIKVTSKRRIYIAAKIQYSYKVLDIRRNKIVFTNSIERYLTSKNARRFFSSTELKSWTVLDYVNYFTSKVAPEIGDETLNSIFPAKVSSVGKENIVINKGKNSEIKIGDKFRVFNPGEKVIDPNTGDYLGDSIEETGVVEIISIHPMYSRAKIIEKKSEIKKGALCINTRSVSIKSSASSFGKKVNEYSNAAGGFFSSIYTKTKSIF